MHLRCDKMSNLAPYDVETRGMLFMDTLSFNSAQVRRAFRLMLSTLCLVCSTFSSANEPNGTDLREIFKNGDIEAALKELKQRGISEYDFGMKLHFQQETHLAMQWYTAIGKRTSDLKYIYGLAWLRLSSGDHKGAIRDAEYILSGTPDSLTKARTLYLLGMVRVQEEKTTEARNLLQEAEMSYKQLGLPAGQGICLLGQARLKVFEGKFSEVEPLLKKSWELNLASIKLGYKSRGMGGILEIRAEMALEKGLYSDALTFFREASQAYRELNYNEPADLLAPKIALALFLTGEPKASLLECTDVWSQYNDRANNEMIMVWNSLVLMKLNLCGQRFEDAGRNELFVKKWAAQNPGGKRMFRLLEKLKNREHYPCPEWR